jgi:hypothetical protein
LEAGRFVAGRFVAGRFVEGRFVGVPLIRCFVSHREMLKIYITSEDFKAYLLKVLGVI